MTETKQLELDNRIREAEMKLEDFLRKHFNIEENSEKNSFINAFVDDYSQFFGGEDLIKKLQINEFQIKGFEAFKRMKGF